MTETALNEENSPALTHETRSSSSFRRLKMRERERVPDPPIDLQAEEEKLLWSLDYWEFCRHSDPLFLQTDEPFLVPAILQM
ncbi:hypothetical protein LINGRAHAP2_LOCUS29810 [Linum grandiflorum]